MREWIDIITETPDGFRVVVPGSQQMRYLRGGCYAFAIVLRRHLRARGFPAKLFGLFEEEDCHHAFVVVRDSYIETQNCQVIRNTSEINILRSGDISMVSLHQNRRP